MVSSTMRHARSPFRSLALACLLAGAGACASAPVQRASTNAPEGLLPGQYPWVQADVDFMSGMIPHHAQAVIMGRWAPERSTNPAVLVLCERMVVAQEDEILTMQTWLRDRGLPVPDGKSTRHRMTMHGMEHDMLMPGMLTDEEMAALERARGPEFDRLFLEGMIRHHQGAIDMVDVLLKSPGAAQDELVFKLANDVYADQTTEIDRMRGMLREVAR